MGGHGKAELGREPSRDLLPLLAAVGRPVDAAVVLLVEVLAPVGRHHQLVHALPELGVDVRLEARPNARVARLPRRPAVAGLEHADRRDADPHAVRVLPVRDDGVEDQATGARFPCRPGPMVGQPLDMFPRGATVAAAEQAGGLDAGVDRVVGRGDIPDGRELGAVVAVREPVAGVGPRRAKVVAAPDGRPVPRAAAPGEQGARAGLEGHVVDRPPLAQRAAKGPLAATGVAVEDEGPLRGADEDHATLGHGDAPVVMAGSAAISVAYRRSRDARYPQPRTKTGGSR